MNHRPMMSEITFRVKAYEIDAVGIVSNIVYIRWFEDLRHALLDAYYPFSEMMETGISPILVKTVAEYKTPVMFCDTPTGQCWIEKLGKSRWEIAIEITSGDTVHCIGRQVGCFYDIAEKKIAPVPERLRAAYEMG